MLFWCVILSTISITSVVGDITVDSLEFVRYGESGNIIIKEESDKLLIKSETREIVSFDSKKIEFLSHFIYKGSIYASTFTSNKIKQWQLFAFDTFQEDESQLWTPNITSQCGNSGDNFLGGFCKLSHGSAIRYYNSLPAHKLVRLTARVHFFDHWTGEYITLSINNNIVWADSYTWCDDFSMNCKTDGIDVCGQEYPDRISVAVDVTVQHTEESMMISFSSTLSNQTDPCQTSWGVDDVALYLL